MIFLLLCCCCVFRFVRFSSSSHFSFQDSHFSHSLRREIEMKKGREKSQREKEKLTRDDHSEFLDLFHHRRDLSSESDPRVHWFLHLHFLLDLSVRPIVNPRCLVTHKLRCVPCFHQFLHRLPFDRKPPLVIPQFFFVFFHRLLCVCCCCCFSIVIECDGK